MNGPDWNEIETQIPVTWRAVRPLTGDALERVEEANVRRLAHGAKEAEEIRSPRARADLLALHERIFARENADTHHGCLYAPDGSRWAWHDGLWHGTAKDDGDDAPATATSAAPWVRREWLRILAGWAPARRVEWITKPEGWIPAGYGGRIDPLGNVWAWGSDGEKLHPPREARKAGVSWPLVPEHYAAVDAVLARLTAQAHREARARLGMPEEAEVEEWPEIKVYIEIDGYDPGDDPELSGFIEAAAERIVPALTAALDRDCNIGGDPGGTYVLVDPEGAALPELAAHAVAALGQMDGVTVLSVEGPL